MKAPKPNVRPLPASVEVNAIDASTAPIPIISAGQPIRDLADFFMSNAPWNCVGGQCPSFGLPPLQGNWIGQAIIASQHEVIAGFKHLDPLLHRTVSGKR
jgi:hypothetical protein